VRRRRRRREDGADRRQNAEKQTVTAPRGRGLDESDGDGGGGGGGGGGGACNNQVICSRLLNLSGGGCCCVCVFVQSNAHHSSRTHRVVFSQLTLALHPFPLTPALAIYILYTRENNICVYHIIILHNARYI